MATKVPEKYSRSHQAISGNMAVICGIVRKSGERGNRGGFVCLEAVLGRLCVIRWTLNWWESEMR